MFIEMRVTAMLLGRGDSVDRPSPPCEYAHVLNIKVEYAGLMTWWKMNCVLFFIFHNTT